MPSWKAPWDWGRGTNCSRHDDLDTDICMQGIRMTVPATYLPSAIPPVREHYIGTGQCGLDFGQVMNCLTCRAQPVEISITDATVTHVAPGWVSVEFSAGLDSVLPAGQHRGVRTLEPQPRM